MNCPYCNQEIKNKIAKMSDAFYDAGECSKHGKVKVILLFDDQNIDHIALIFKDQKYEYSLCLNYTNNNSILESRSNQITLLDTRKEIFNIDHIINIVPEEFPDRLKLWLNFY